MREYHAKNRERLNREDREQHARNPEIKRRASNKYYRNNKTLCYLSRRRCKLSIYGLTPEDYDRLAEKQEQRCAICKASTYNGAQELAVDHCHKTYIVRGLLCRRCNLGLGHFEDSPELLAAAIQYLKDAHANQ